MQTAGKRKENGSIDKMYGRITKGKVREVGERTEVGEGTIGAIGSIEPTIADGLEQPTLMLPLGH